TRLALHLAGHRRGRHPARTADRRRAVGSGRAERRSARAAHGADAGSHQLALVAVVTAAFGQVVAEVGAAMIVGGNIRGETRTLTTAVATATAQGDFGFALALGLVLILVALLVNIALQALQGRGRT